MVKNASGLIEEKRKPTLGELLDRIHGALTSINNSLGVGAVDAKLLEKDERDVTLEEQTEDLCDSAESVLNRLRELQERLQVHRNRL